jgi:hypothetical protein
LLNIIRVFILRATGSKFNDLACDETLKQEQNSKPNENRKPQAHQGRFELTFSGAATGSGSIATFGIVNWIIVRMPWLNFFQ